MATESNPGQFGEFESLRSLVEIESFIQHNAARAKIRMQAAAYGLVLVASNAVGKSQFFADSCQVLDQVVQAKARIDIAAWHSIEVAQVTSAVLLAAQTFLDEQTIPCTEWPTPREVANAVHEAARVALSFPSAYASSSPGFHGPV
jgi:hypothetical protein